MCRMKEVLAVAPLVVMLAMQDGIVTKEKGTIPTGSDLQAEGKKNGFRFKYFGNRKF